MFVLLLGLASCLKLMKLLQGKKLVTFYEEVKEEDQYSDLLLSKISQTTDLYYRIIPPEGKAKEISGESQTVEESVDVEAFELPLERNVNVKLEKPGLWTIQLYNRANDTEKYTISCHAVKKVVKGNEDITALRNVLNAMQNAVEALGNENYHSNHMQQHSIAEAELIKKRLKWLLALPFITVGISYGKGVLERQLVRPKGKRFKGLF